MDGRTEASCFPGSGRPFERSASLSRERQTILSDLSVQEVVNSSETFDMAELEEVRTNTE